MKGAPSAEQIFTRPLTVMKAGEEEVKSLDYSYTWAEKKIDVTLTGLVVGRWHEYWKQSCQNL